MGNLLPGPRDLCPSNSVPAPAAQHRTHNTRKGTQVLKCYRFNDFLEEFARYIPAHAKLGEPTVAAPFPIATPLHDIGSNGLAEPTTAKSPATRDAATATPHIGKFNAEDLLRREVSAALDTGENNGEARRVGERF